MARWERYRASSTFWLCSRNAMVIGLRDWMNRMEVRVNGSVMMAFLNSSPDGGTALMLDMSQCGTMNRPSTSTMAVRRLP